MKISWIKALLALSLAISSIQAAPIVYNGTLTSGVPVNGSIDAGTLCSLCGATGAEGLNFWSFFGTAGDSVTIAVDRIDFNLDPAFSLFFGFTSADDSTVFGSNFFGDDFDTLTFLIEDDDTVSHPGPYSDPLISNFVLSSTGIYTIVVGAAASDPAGELGGNSAYTLTLNGATGGSTVPEPGSMGLMGAGLAGLFYLGRRIRR